jgi:hypothetical protein
MGEVCDFGEFRQLIVSPQCVTSKLNRTMRHPKQRVINEVRIEKKKLVLRSQI